jgi:molecular chaperone Hsp33
MDSMAILTRALSDDGSVMAMAIDSTDLVRRAEQIHRTSAVITAAAGRLLTAASMMGWLLKGEGDTVTLRLDGGGPAGVLIAAADSQGRVRVSPQNPVVELPLNEKGKLDVGGAVGRAGSLSVIRDLGLREPYIGQVPLVSGEVAEDITSYFAVSEQTPTVCGLGVLVNPDLTVRSAGGFLVQLLPFAGEGSISQLEQNIAGLPPVSAVFDSGMSPEALCKQLLDGLGPQILDECRPSYYCPCSRGRVERALVSLGPEELADMIREDHGAEVCCHFCDKRYCFSEDELAALLRQCSGKGEV